MTEYLIACDLGTGGMKATLCDRALSPVAETFAAYPTYYPAPEWHEQSISDWWNALVFCTHDLIRMSGAEPQSIRGIALSGASLVAVPIGKDGLPLCERVPIWSDKRAVREAEAFFLKTSSNTWYRATGNGFPAACYPLFKLLWMKQHLPDIYERTAFTLGSKDYLNFRMTGIAATDHSYASGTGAYHLTERRMMPELMREAGVREELFLPPVPPHTPVGALTKEAAEQMGLARGTFVFCGGVDNACMALGTVGTQKNRAYVSLGTSSWIPVNAEKPVLDERTRPYTFAHIEKNLYTSAYSVFSGGSSLEWVKNTLLGDGASYEALTALALSSPAGARGVMFHPGLAGGTMQDGSIHTVGGFFGLHLGTTKADLARAAFEGIAFHLKDRLDLLCAQCQIDAPLVFCGGGSRNDAWLQMFADIFGRGIVRTDVGRTAATLGAAQCAARGLGWYDSYQTMPVCHKIEYEAAPDPRNAARYAELFALFQKMMALSSDYGEALHAIAQKGAL